MLSCCIPMLLGGVLSQLAAWKATKAITILSTCLLHAIATRRLTFNLLVVCKLQVHHLKFCSDLRTPEAQVQIPMAGPFDLKNMIAADLDFLLRPPGS